MVIELVAAAALLAAEAEEVTIAGPEGPIMGTLIDPTPEAPAIVLIAGSGPTDRNGDNPMGVKGSVYRQLAEALAAEGIAVLRFDKRGLFASKDAVADPNDVSLAAYADDAAAWAKLLAERGKQCSWIMGHSEGGAITLTAAAEHPEGLCGVILLASPGRPLGVVLREQLGRQLPPAMMEQAEAAIATLEAGERVDIETVPGPLRPLFNPAVQGYLIELAGTDPADLARRVALPMLIVHFEEDLQVARADADALSAGQPGATRIDLDGVNHVFKKVEPGNPAANAATYGNADLAIDPRLAETIAAFVKAER